MHTIASDSMMTIPVVVVKCSSLVHESEKKSVSENEKQQQRQQSLHKAKRPAHDSTDVTFTHREKDCLLQTVTEAK